MKRRLTLLSDGNGQDSTAIAYKLHNDPAFRQKYAPGDLLVGHAATGIEWPFSMMHMYLMQEYHRQRGVPYYHITPDMGYHAEGWQSLEENFRRYNVVMTNSFRRSCTDQLKIQPIYRFLNHWVATTYGIQEFGPVYKAKHALVEFARRYGKIRVIIGISRGEESRISEDDSFLPKWQRLSIKKVYPLVDLGWDRRDCQEYIRSLGQMVPPPSHCMMCPYMSKQELLLLYRKHPDIFMRWADHEARKLEKFKHMGDKNYCVLHRKKTLLQVLEDAKAQFGHMTTEELEERHFSMGHCVASKY